MTVIQPEGWVPPRGYANGIVATGRLLFTGGQIGWNPRVAKPEYSPEFSTQFQQALSNVCEVVAAAGGTPQHLTRLTVYVTDKKAYLDSLMAIGVAWRRLLGKHYPAMALVQVVALVEDWAMVEIEGTAVLP
jgi:enamine deaminase RidA (YjgF/YER057c/UK114 family)